MFSVFPSFAYKKRYAITAPTPAIIIFSLLFIFRFFE